MLKYGWKKLREDIRKNPRIIRHTAALFAAQIAVIIIGFLIKGIQTRALGPETYGLYAFFGTVTGILAIVFRFGHYNSIKVLLAENKDPEKERQYFGLGLLTAIAIGFLYALTIFLLSFLIDYRFGSEYGQIFRLFAAFTIVYPMQFMISDLSVGSNRIYPSALMEIGSKLLYLIPLYILFSRGSLDLYQVIFLNLLTGLVAVTAVFIWLRPSFKHLDHLYAILKKKNREYGWHFYLGIVSNQTTYRLDEVFIATLINTTQLGFYSLAGLICSPMVMLSRALSQSMFKRLAHSSKIPAKLFIYNTLWLLFAIIVVYFLAEPVVTFLFGGAFAPVAEYAFWLSFAYFFQGAYQPFSFLSAKSQGKALRNVAFVEAAVNVLGNIILIKFYGIYGVIAASILARFVQFSGLFYYYRKYLKTHLKKE